MDVGCVFGKEWGRLSGTAWKGFAMITVEEKGVSNVLLVTGRFGACACRPPAAEARPLG